MGDWRRNFGSSPRPRNKHPAAFRAWVWLRPMGGLHRQEKTVIDAKLWQDSTACERKQPLTRPATAGEIAVAGHHLPKGEGWHPDGVETTRG
jgi:hypothetical protein